MPQLDPTSFSSQLFWLVVSVFALFIFMWKVAMPRIGDLVDLRKSKVESDLADAETMRLAAEEAKVEHEHILADARGDGMKLINQSILEAERHHNQQHREMEKNSESQLQEADKRITIAKQEALAKIAPVAEEITTLMVNKLLKLDLTNGDVKKAVSSLKDAA